MTGKLGVQIIGGNFPVDRLVGVNKPSVVKLVDPSLEYFNKVRAVVGPTCTIIIRWYDRYQMLDNPEHRANEWFNNHRDFIMSTKSNYTLYEGYNEIADSMANSYCRFELERIRLAEQVGAWLCIGNWSVGVPDFPLWNGAYAPLVAACKGYHAIGLHEYWAYTSSISFTWLCARWKMVPALSGKRIVITECGRDYIGALQAGQPGWKRTCDKQTFLNDLKLYNLLMENSPNVLGCTIFQVGAIDSEWYPFDVSELMPEIVETYKPEAAQPQPPVEEVKPVLVIDGRLMQVEEFRRHVSATNISWADTVVIHHTYLPTLEQWKTCGWECRKENMRKYYQDVRGWDAGPHLFIGPEGIGLFNPLNKPGIGVIGHNNHTIHIEVVGDYTDDGPKDSVLSYAVLATAILLVKLKGNEKNLTYHRRLQSNTTCPGDGFVSMWPWFVSVVMEEAYGLDLSQEEVSITKVRWHIEQAYRELKAAGVPESSIGMRRINELVKLPGGLIYKLENKLGGE